MRKETASLSEEQTKDPPIPIAGYITDMPEEKILKLTQSDLDRMITLQMAAHGIRLVEKPTEPTYHVIPEKDVNLYKIEGVKYSFTKIEDAQKVAEVLIPLAMRMRGNDYFYDDTVEKIALKEYGNEPFSISPVTVYSAGLWSQISSAREENKRLKTDYEKQLKEYEGSYSDAQWVRDEVMNRYYEVTNKYDEMDRLVRQYRTYLEVAEGNDDFAWKFLKKAFLITADQESYIRQQIAANPSPVNPN